MTTGTALLLVAAGWWYVLFVPAPSGRDQPPTPAVHVETGPGGAPAARIDHESLRRACGALGLPDPPDFNGADPVPVRHLLDRIGQWAATCRPEAVGELGEVYLALALDREALVCFAAAEALDPGDDRWAYLAAVECETLGHVDEAVKRYRRCLEREPEYVTAAARLAAIQLQRGALDESQAGYEIYRSRRPQESLGYVGLARVALSRNDPGAALDLLLEAVRRSPGDFLAWRMLARAYALNGRSAEARLASARAAKLPQFRGWLTFDPRLQEAHRLARTQRYLENQLHIATTSARFALGAELALELLSRRPGDAEVMARLAGCYQQMGRVDLAAQSADAAAQVAPASPAVRRMQAEIALAQGRNAAAGAAAEALLQSDPDSARGHELLGRVRFLQGDTADGIRLARRAVELDPEAAEARQALVTMLTHIGRLDEAAAVREGRSDGAPERRRDEGKSDGG